MDYGVKHFILVLFFAMHVVNDLYLFSKEDVLFHSFSVLKMLLLEVGKQTCEANISEVTYFVSDQIKAKL